MAHFSLSTLSLSVTRPHPTCLIPSTLNAVPHGTLPNPVPWPPTRQTSTTVNKPNRRLLVPALSCMSIPTPRSTISLPSSRSTNILSLSALFTFQTLHGLYSLLCPSRATKSLHATKSARSKSAYAEAAALTPTPSTAHRSLFPTSLFPRSPAPFSPGTTGGLKSPPLTTVSERPKETWGTEAKEAPAMPRHALAGGLQPMTPRTQAFNRLGGTKDLPLRNHFSSPNVPRSPTFGVTSPLAATFSMGDDDRDVEKGVEEREMKPMYFPPPPKMANKANKK